MINEQASVEQAVLTENAQKIASSIIEIENQVRRSVTSDHFELVFLAIINAIYGTHA